MTKQEIQKWCKTNGYELTKKNYKFLPLTETQIMDEGIHGAISRVAKMTGITQEQLLTITRKDKFMKPRQLVQAIANKYLLNLSQKEIAIMTGGVNRTTVYHSTKSVKGMIKTDKYYRYRYGPIIELYGLK